MENIKKQSFEKREAALNKSIASKRGLFKYLRAEHTLIRDDIRYWLVTFSKGPEASQYTDKRIEWLLKIWVWDSYENKLSSEHIIKSLAEKEHPLIPGTGIEFIHIGQEANLVVVKLSGFDPGFYRFDGTVIQYPEYDKNHFGRPHEGLIKYSSTKYLFNKDFTQVLMRAADRKVVLFKLDTPIQTGRVEAIEVSVLLDDWATMKHFSLHQDKLLFLHVHGAPPTLESRRSGVYLFWLLERENVIGLPNFYQCLGEFTSVYSEDEPVLNFSDEGSVKVIQVSIASKHDDKTRALFSMELPID